MTGAQTAQPQTMRLKVVDTFEATLLVRGVVLAAGDGADLPPFAAGSHLRVRLPGDYDDRHYSLVDLPGRAGRYVLAVQLGDHSRGGARFMHNLTAGDRIRVEGPRQNFPLHDGDGPAVLVAGGIGITPLVSMAAALARDGRDFRLHYAGRRPDALAFVTELRAICGDRLRLHDGTGPRLDLAAVVAAAGRRAHLYVCGPARMIEAARRIAAARGVPEAQVQIELFEAPHAGAADRPFEVELASDGRILTVPAGMSALQVLEQAGLAPEFDCRRGGCGMCRVRVLDGVPDHRDVILTQRERAAGAVMQICVSRAMTARLVLDL